MGECEVIELDTLEFAPAGSFVVRIGHKGRTELDGPVLWVCVNAWRRGQCLSLRKALKSALQATISRLQPALHPDVCKSLESHLGKEQLLTISQSVQAFCEAAVVTGQGNTANEIASYLRAEGFEPSDIDRLQHQALGAGVSIEKTLQPRLQWMLDLGLTKGQVAKAVATRPQILGYSVENNLKSTVQWLLDLGLTKSQVAKAVADFPQILGLSIGNLTCKVKLLQSFLPPTGAVKIIVKCPRILSYSQRRLQSRLHVLSEQDSLEKLVSGMVLTDEAFHRRFFLKNNAAFYATLEGRL